MTIRTFIAIETGKEARDRLETLIGRLKKGVSFFPIRPGWVKPDNIHITLKFLGNIDEEVVPEIVARMTEVAQPARPFAIRAAGMGVFPNKNRPRVLWVGVRKGKTDLVQIQQHLDRLLVPLGFEAEQREFHPHLTLARIKALKGTTALMKVVKEHQDFSDVGEWDVDRLVLFRSVLHPEGAIYTPLQEVVFGQP